MEPFRATLSLLLCYSLLSRQASLKRKLRSGKFRPTFGPAAYQPGQLRGDERILHALNRFTFGPRPATSILCEPWASINGLRANCIRDNRQYELEARLAQFPAMQWSTRDLLYRLPSNAVLRQAAQGKRPFLKPVRCRQSM